MPAQVTAAIPLPIQIVIDDVGWWSGENGSTRQEPYRTGFVRDHVLADYEALASLGRQLKMRPQAAFILCEWDKANILRDLPSCTWMGKSWDNSRWVGPWLEEAAEFIRANRNYFELTLHGVGHEYWQATPEGDWRFTRAEWCDSEGNMRPRKQVLVRLEYFQRLMEQHNLGDFPTSFVPCAFRHRFEDSQHGLAAIFIEHGINFISTPYRCMHGVEKVEYGKFGFEAGIMTADRGGDLMPWYAFGSPPNAELQGPICGMHWPNILHPNPERNEEVVSEWVRLLQPYNLRVDRILARDTQEFATQLAHYVTTSCTVAEDGAKLDFLKFDKLPQAHFSNQITVKVSTPQPLHFSCAETEILSVDSTGEGTQILYSLSLKTTRKTATVQLKWANQTQ